MNSRFFSSLFVTATAACWGISPIFAVGETVTGGVGSGIGTSGGASYSVTPKANVPVISRLPTPVVLSFASATASQIGISWTASEDVPFTSYKVYRDTTSGVSTASPLAETITNQSTLTHTSNGLANGTGYYYRVYTINSLGSAASNEVLVNTSAGGGGGSGSSGGGGGGSSSAAKKSTVSTVKTTTSTTLNPTTSSSEKMSSVLFRDVEGHWAQNYIEDLTKSGIFKNRTEFRPNDGLLRAELVKILVEAFKVPLEKGSSFSDVKNTDWYASYVLAAKKANIISGYTDGTFKPSQSVTRAEALKMVFETIKAETEKGRTPRFSDVPADSWFAPYVNYAVQNGIVQGKTTQSFAPADAVTRAEIAKIISKVIKTQMPVKNGK